MIINPRFLFRKQYLTTIALKNLNPFMRLDTFPMMGMMNPFMKPGMMPSNPKELFCNLLVMPMINAPGIMPSNITNMPMPGMGNINPTQMQQNPGMMQPNPMMGMPGMMPMNPGMGFPNMQFPPMMGMQGMMNPNMQQGGGQANPQ
jgi:hypothetical protein